MYSGNTGDTGWRSWWNEAGIGGGTMKVLLIDLDGKLPNLALMKLSTWHKAHGDEVYLNTCDRPDKAYISTLFTWNRPKVKRLQQIYPGAEVGGFGWDFIVEDGTLKEIMHTELPPEIEGLIPDYDLYTTSHILPRIKGGIATRESKERKAQVIVDAGIGFSSRGCIRKCGFCGVRIKEGEFRQVAEIKDLLNPRSNVIILLDNNLTADPDCIEKLHEIRDRGLTVDISQGIDVRLLTPEIAQALGEIKHLRSLHYAWDLIPFEKQVMDGIKLLSRYVKTWRHMCFVLTGYDTTFEEDMYRFRKLTEIGIRPYIMPYNKEFKDKRHFHFTGWVNSRKHTACRFEEYEPWVRSQSDMQVSLV
jgi:hypothetical protein